MAARAGPARARRFDPYGRRGDLYLRPARRRSPPISRAAWDRALPPARPLARRNGLPTLRPRPPDPPLLPRVGRNGALRARGFSAELFEKSGDIARTRGMAFLQAVIEQRARAGDPDPPLGSARGLRWARRLLAPSSPPLSLDGSPRLSRARPRDGAPGVDCGSARGRSPCPVTVIVGELRRSVSRRAPIPFPRDLRGDPRRHRRRRPPSAPREHVGLARRAVLPPRAGPECILTGSPIDDVARVEGPCPGPEQAFRTPGAWSGWSESDRPPRIVRSLQIFLPHRRPGVLQPKYSGKRAVPRFAAGTAAKSFGAPRSGAQRAAAMDRKVDVDRRKGEFRT